MKFRALFTLFMTFLLIACGSYSSPFENINEKKNALKLIKSNIDVSNSEFNVIKTKDSILYQLSISINNPKMKPQLIERRLDSFFLSNYTQKELLAILKLDEIGGWEIEFDKTNSTNQKGNLQLKSIEEAKKFLQKFDSVHSGKNRLILSSKLDSTTYSDNKIVAVLTRVRYEYVKDNVVVKREIINAINDSLNKKLIRRRVDSFISKKYTEMMLISSLELDRVFKGKNITLENAKNVDLDKLQNFDSKDELRAFIKKLSEQKKTKIIIVKDSSKLDTLSKVKIKGN